MPSGGRVENPHVCDLLFKKIERPSNLVTCKAINVYDNKYRINVYTQDYDEIMDIEKTTISQSFFAVYKDNELCLNT